MNVKQKNIWTVDVMLVMLSLIFIYTSSTYLRSRYSFYLALASYAAFFLISVFFRQKWRFDKVYFWALFAALVCPIYILNGAGGKLTTYLSGVIYIFFWYNIFVYLAENYTRKTIKKFAVINLIILATNILTTTRVLELYPLAARAINGKAEGITERDIALYTDMGCGGFGFIYGTVFLSLGIAAAFRAKDISVKMRVFAIVFYVLVFNMILAAQFTTALLLTVAMLLFCLVMNSKKLGINLFIIGVVCIFIAVFSQQILGLIQSIAEALNIGYLADKMDMVLSASDSDSIDSLSRSQRYMQSLKGFASSPIIGSGTSGGHSQILDTFSTIGIFAMPYVMLLFSIFKSMRRYIDKKYVFIFSAGILILATVNPFVDSTIISLAYMLTPTLLYCFVPQQRKLAEKNDEQNNI